MLRTAGRFQPEQAADFSEIRISILRQEMFNKESGLEMEEEADFEEAQELEPEAPSEPGEVDIIDDPVRMYLSEIGRLSLINADEEKELAKQREKGKCVEAIEQELV